MILSRTVTGWLLLGLLGGALAQGCGSSNGPKRPLGSGASNGNAGKDAGSMVVEPPGTSGSGGESPYDPACGIAEVNGCVPDLADNPQCKSSSAGTAGRSNPPAVAGTGGTGGGKSSGAGGRVGESGASGEAGASHGGAGASAGESSAAGAGGAPDHQGGQGPGDGGQSSLGGAGAGASGEGGVPMSSTGGRPGSAGRASTGGAGQGTSGGAPVLSDVSCQVVESAAHKGAAVAKCMPAGTGQTGAPCFSGADCAPSFACVGDGPGQCLAYCCSTSDSCKSETGTHCAMQGLVPDATSGHSLEVPVCTPAVKCSLAEPYPCDDAHFTCSCPKESACVVVGDDGTTSCVPVKELGKGTENEECPCAWGYVCSLTKECVKLCEFAAHVCRCQVSPNLPEGWGTCIGEDAGAP